MVLTAGIISLISSGSNSAKLSTTAASGGTAPYTQQWYRDTSGAGFTPGIGNILLNSTALTLDNAGLVPNTTYYYKVVYTDATTSTVESTAFVVTTLPASQGMNQFSMAAILGQLDLQNGPKNVVAAQVDASQLTPLYPGQPIKFVNSPYGIPTVVAAGSDMPNGYIVYDQKSPSFKVGTCCEIAKTLSCIWLYATSAIERGSMVVLDPNVASGVQQVTGNSDLPIIGEAYNQATAAGQLLRIILNVPSNMYDTPTGSQDFLMPISRTLSGNGTYTPTSSPRPPLYIRLRLWGAGGGGAGSAKGVTSGAGEDGGDSSFGTDFVAGGGKGGTIAAGGDGGGYTVGLPLDGLNFNGQNGSYNVGTGYDTAFAVNPYVLQNYLGGGAGGNSMFPGAGVSSTTNPGAVENTGCGGAGANINAHSVSNPSAVFNSGCGGGGGGYIDYILSPTEAEFSIGQGGAGGTAGVGGADGGAGANGGGILTEYFQ